VLKEIIRELIAPESRKRRIRGDHIAAILEQLRSAQERLESRLDNETEPVQRRHLELELEVNRLQQRKGIRQQLELKERCE